MRLTEKGYSVIVLEKGKRFEDKDFAKSNWQSTRCQKSLQKDCELQTNMNNFELRPYTPSDAQVVVDVINASSMQTIGFPRAVVDAIGNVWSHHFVPFSSERIVAINRNNEIVGYAYFTSEDDHIAAETGGDLFIPIIGEKELAQL